MSDLETALSPSTSAIPEVAIRLETGGFDDTPLERIEQILNEEEDIEKCSMFHDPLALRAMEDSFFQVLSHDKGSSSTFLDRRDHLVNLTQSIETNGPVHSSFPTKTLSISDFAIMFSKGIEEANKFLPRETTSCIDLEMKNSDNTKFLAPMHKNDDSRWAAKAAKMARLVDVGREKEVQELVVMFKRLFSGLAPYGGDSMFELGSLNSDHMKKQKKMEELVDLDRLILSCAQAISVDNRSNSYEILQQIREHSSATGDGPQRCAHYFANGLEARLAGTRTAHMRSELKMLPEADILRIAKALMLVCPFRAIDFYLGEHHIQRLAKEAQTLHVIDFGNTRSFRWVKIIEELAARPGGPPRFRFTGIDYPQMGISPTELVERERRSLLKCCEQLNVQIEYNGIITHKWEGIRVEDLKISKNEAIVVNCTQRFEKLLDEVVGVNNPRSAVLDLIRKMNPSIFIHTTTNGSLNVPVFHIRLRAALYHFSACYDMLDSLFMRESEEREMMERTYLGSSIMNVVACEGLERDYRPESYRQWQVRTRRAGFRQLPLDRELMRKWKALVESKYHKEYLIEEDENWLLQGWKGRILYGTCCWVPQ